MFYAIYPYSLVPEDITYKNVIKVQRNHFTMLALGAIAILACMGFICACWYSNWSFSLTYIQTMIMSCLVMTSVVFGVLGGGYCLTRRHMLRRLKEEETIELEEKKEPNLSSNVKV